MPLRYSKIDSYSSSVTYIKQLIRDDIAIGFLESGCFIVKPLTLRPLNPSLFAQSKR